MTYSEKTIAKFVRLMKARIAYWMAIAIQLIPMCISNGNRKIGRVLNVSLPAIISCGNCAQCRKKCYDIKACLLHCGDVGALDARARNWAVLQKDRDEYFRRIETKIARRKKNLYFRWHVAGEIVDLDYFNRMVEIARKYPAFTFWTYTKMYGIINLYCRMYGKDSIPSNLSVMFSEWRGMPMENPYGFPEYRVVFKDDAIRPEGFYCPGNCDICKAARRGCVVGESVYCDEH